MALLALGSGPDARGIGKSSNNLRSLIHRLFSHYPLGNNFCSVPVTFASGGRDISPNGSVDRALNVRGRHDSLVVV